MNTVALSSTELEDIAPLLIGSGAAALGWRSISQTHLRDSKAGAKLHDAFRLLSLEDSFRAERIKRVFGSLRSAGIEPLLVKGWSVARLYPDAALRPSGDIDICVSADTLEKASEILKSSELADCWVDLHETFSELKDRPTDELYARSQLVRLDDVDIRILCEEDHLALLSVHMLKHGAWRPLWLCDIGAAIETRSPRFNWNLCFGENATRANWIKCSIRLAHDLLGARIDNTPLEGRTDSLRPAWLLKSVLKEWETPYAANQAPMKHAAPMASYLRNPSGLARGLYRRWPNPIKATIDMEWSLNSIPRLSAQAGYSLFRLVRFLSNLPAMMREQ